MQVNSMNKTIWKPSDVAINPVNGTYSSLMRKKQEFSNYLLKWMTLLINGNLWRCTGL